jgi:hypothetical protein
MTIRFLNPIAVWQIFYYTISIEWLMLCRKNLQFPV